tara:strand:+ start:567 stop:848 length:282 start_codon:yes stop_codon:yes gene_type:complete
MSKLTREYNLNGQRALLADLSEAMARQNIKAVSHAKGSPEWHLWREWRKRNGLGTSYMDNAKKFSVPCDMPPSSSLETAVDEAKAGMGGMKRV